MGRHLAEHADHGLRVIAAGNLGQDVLGDLDHLALGLEGGGDSLAQQGMAVGLLAVHQDRGRLAQLHRLGDDLQALGHE